MRIRRFDESKEDDYRGLVNEISDLFLTNVFDKWDMSRTDRVLGNQGTFWERRSDLDRPRYHESISDTNISIKIWIPVTNEIETEYSHKSPKWHQMNMERFYPGLYSDLERVISRSYSECSRRKLRFDWRSTTSEKDGMEIYVIGYGARDQYIKVMTVEVRFRIDTKYDWELENKQKKERIRNMMIQTGLSDQYNKLFGSEES